MNITFAGIRVFQLAPRNYLTDSEKTQYLREVFPPGISEPIQEKDRIWAYKDPKDQDKVAALMARRYKEAIDRFVARVETKMNELVQSQPNNPNYRVTTFDVSPLTNMTRLLVLDGPDLTQFLQAVHDKKQLLVSLLANVLKQNLSPEAQRNTYREKVVQNKSEKAPQAVNWGAVMAREGDYNGIVSIAEYTVSREFANRANVEVIDEP
jgi:hypothetical protein